jgi:hypothetical protein
MCNTDKIVSKRSDIEKFRLKKGEDSFGFTGFTFECEMDSSYVEFIKVLFIETKGFANILEVVENKPPFIM